MTRKIYTKPIIESIELDLSIQMDYVSPNANKGAENIFNGSSKGVNNQADIRENNTNINIADRSLLAGDSPRF